MSDAKIKLLSSEGESFFVEREVVVQSETLKSMLEDDVDADSGIPLPNVTSKTLSKVIEYCKYHVEAKKAPTAEKSAPSADEIKAFDEEYAKVDQSTLFEIILVSYCLFPPFSSGSFYGSITQP